jgi:cyclophilin family peptidyl-prolyl cis-trans isomerase
MRTPDFFVFSINLRILSLLLTLLAWGNIRADVKEIAVFEISGGSLGSGTLEFELLSDRAPKTVANFRYLAESGFYDGTKFHRLISNFMIQGGDPISRFDNWSQFYGQGNPGFVVPDERPDYPHVRGVLSMANAGASTTGSQFFIMLEDDNTLASPQSGVPPLHQRHAAFGRVVADPGDLLTRLQSQQTTSRNSGSAEGESAESGEKSIPVSAITLRRVRIRRDFTPPDVPSLLTISYAGKLESPSLRANINSVWNNAQVSTPLDRFLYQTVSSLAGTPIQGPPIPVPVSFARCTGKFSVAVTRSGRISGRANYFGREFPFRGQLALQRDGTFVHTGSLGSASGSSVNAEIRVLPSLADKPGILSFRLLSANPAEAPLAAGAAEPVTGSAAQTPIQKFTGLITPPNWYDFRPEQTKFAPAPQQGEYVINGFGTFAFNTLTNTKLVIGRGFFPDGRPMTFSAPVAREGCRTVASIFSCELMPGIQAQIEAIRSFALNEWWYFSYILGRKFIAAEIQMPEAEPVPTSPSYTWFYSADYPSRGISIPKYFGSSESEIQRWIPLSSKAAPENFPDYKGVLLLLGQQYEFDISRNLREGTFPNAPSIRLQFDFLNGTFTGSCYYSTQAKPTEKTLCPIRGVFLSTQGMSGLGQLFTPEGTFTVALKQPPLLRGINFLRENAGRDGVTTLPSGLQIKVLQEGTGNSPLETDTVVVHYRGRLLDGTEFDSSYSRGTPAEFPLTGVIPGWTEGLQLIREGGKAELYIPSSLAYGSTGSPPSIGPNETLVFEVELLSIKPPAEQ